MAQSSTETDRIRTKCTVNLHHMGEAIQIFEIF